PVTATRRAGVGSACSLSSRSSCRLASSVMVRFMATPPAVSLIPRRGIDQAGGGEWLEPAEGVPPDLARHVDPPDPAGPAHFGRVVEVERAARRIPSVQGRLGRPPGGGVRLLPDPTVGHRLERAGLE